MRWAGRSRSRRPHAATGTVRSCGVRLDLADEEQLRAAFDTLSGPTDPGLVVQRMAPPRVAVTVGAVEDPVFGPLVSFGVAGVATDLLGDRAYRILPLS